MNSNRTCVTIDTIEQQNPPRNAVANIVSTDFANTVKIHDNENGNDIKVNSLRRPYCREKPPKMPPTNAPAFNKEKIQNKIIIVCFTFPFKFFVLICFDAMALMRCRTKNILTENKLKAPV